MRRPVPLLLLALVLLAGCGDDDAAPVAETPAPTATAAPTTEPADPVAPTGETGGATPFIGSLTVDPGDGTLIAGTGLGAFRLEAGAKRAEPFDGELTTPDATGAISANLVLRFTGPGRADRLRAPEGRRLRAARGPRPHPVGRRRGDVGVGLAARRGRPARAGRARRRRRRAAGRGGARARQHRRREDVRGAHAAGGADRPRPRPGAARADRASPPRTACSCRATAARAGASATCSRPRRTSRGRRPGRSTASTRRAA